MSKDPCGSVRIQRKLIPLIDKLVERSKHEPSLQDVAGVPLFRSQQEVATKAVTQLLKRFKVLEAEKEVLGK